jgi:pimeloyl-ACP methyl ester carboxylesterase
MSMLPPSVPPAALAEPPFEAASFVTSHDGTRLFTHSTEIHRTQDTRAFFCDGIGCDGFIWKHLWAPVLANMPITHWNYRGHGRSSQPRDVSKIEIEDHARDLQMVRESMGDPPCVLIGHSMGVQVALETYRLFPARIKALVLICGSYGKVTQTVRGVPILEMILPSLLRFVDKYPEIVRAVWTRVPHEMALKLALKMGDLDQDNPRIEDVIPYMTHMTTVDLGMFFRMLKAAGDHTAEPMLGDVKVPVLIVAAERDTFTPVWLSESMRQKLPESEYFMVPGGSHAAAVERPELVNDVILTFLARFVSRSAA